MDVRTLAHRFFHESDQRGTYANCNYHFSRNWYKNDEIDFYSYSTVIATIRQNLHGVNVVLISDHNYSNTTSKHISAVHHAAPCAVLYVPYAERYHFYGFLDIFQQIATYTEKQLQRADVRRKVTRTLQMFSEYCKNFADVPAEIKKLAKSAKIRKVIAKCAEIESARMEAAKRIAARTPEQKAADREKRMQAAARRLERFVNTDDVLMKLRATFRPYQLRSMNTDLRTALNEYRRTLNCMQSSTGRRFSFVWMEGENCCTSQNVTVKTADVARMLRVWKSGRDIIGARISMYTITAKNDEFIQIGCHCIPVWNLNALHAALNGAE